MNEKMTSAIESVTLNAATFQGEEFKPNFINFFYGRNGAGKSTLSEAIENDCGLIWRKSTPREHYDVLVYNQAFIDNNFSNFDNLPGVLTIHEQNIEVQKKLEEKAKRKSEIEQEGVKISNDRTGAEAARTSTISGFQDMCWDKLKSLRTTFDAVVKGKKNKNLFSEALLAVPAPADHDLDELKKLYDVAFDLNSRPYHVFAKIDTVSTYGTLPGHELLDRAVSSSSDTDFSRFIKALNATDWVHQGHKNYHKSASGKCPYCQQDLPASFETDIASCFDAQYQQDVDDLTTFQTTYAKEMGDIISGLKGNLTDVLPTVDLTEYKDKLSILERSVEINNQRIAGKIKEPTTIVALEDTDSVLIELGQIIDEINHQIMTNNSIVNDKRKKQEQCKRDAWVLMAFTIKDEIEEYKKKIVDFDALIAGYEQKTKDLRAEFRTVASEILELNKQSVNTVEAINNINNLLADSGFQGFSLKPKKGVQNTYEVIRYNGELADRLSEGERNFIAFLYFHQLVRGNGKANSSTSYGKFEETPEGTDTRDKIVVIDDPVSSMDSSALFIVSALVREMVEVCYNNTDYLGQQVPGDYIKQIFVLTHNVYFHREITYHQVSRYRSVNFYIIRKSDNVSTIKLCERQNDRIRPEMENYNPVQNSYASLWDEFKSLTTPIPVRNVIRQILEYYFLQLCGYEGSDLRKEVLDKHRDLFITQVEDGKPDMEKYHLASSMLLYISNPQGISDGLNYVEDSDDVDMYKNVFRLIFEAMGQDQHYKMMMGEE